jgi:hypothetical protein
MSNPQRDKIRAAARERAEQQQKEHRQSLASELVDFQEDESAILQRYDCLSCDDSRLIAIYPTDAKRYKELECLKCEYPTNHRRAGISTEFPGGVEDTDSGDPTGSLYNSEGD